MSIARPRNARNARSDALRHREIRTVDRIVILRRVTMPINKVDNPYSRSAIVYLLADTESIKKRIREQIVDVIRDRYHLAEFGFYISLTIPREVFRALCLYISMSSCTIQLFNAPNKIRC